MVREPEIIRDRSGGARSARPSKQNNNFKNEIEQQDQMMMAMVTPNQPKKGVLVR